ncbi:MAG TPA: GlsB/YeaQ/YmgE family stress response membrane protein [Chloroflexota bacterium]|jgi:uncharacterized membrane protein YeaQ/YmgE (transglycosylase-associated protein family)|nr:GlsB/YeaQ/YmgE family stress response membrane protein [Chloroflexota bacterium]
MDLTSLLIFLLLGLVAGWLAGLVMKGGYGLVGDMVVGVIGAFLGGWLSSMLFGVSVTGFNPLSILIAFVGAVLFIAVLRLVSGRRATV